MCKLSSDETSDLVSDLLKQTTRPFRSGMFRRLTVNHVTEAENTSFTSQQCVHAVTVILCRDNASSPLPSTGFIVYNAFPTVSYMLMHYAMATRPPVDSVDRLLHEKCPQTLFQFFFIFFLSTSRVFLSIYSF